MLLVADGRNFAVRGQLPLEFRVEVTNIILKMFGNVPGNQFNAVVGTVYGVLVVELTLDVGFLLVAEAVGDAFKPGVNSFLVDVQFRLALFIQEWAHRFILHRPLHGIGMDDGAEFADGFFLSQQRRAGKGDVGRIGQGRAHALVCSALLAAVPFVHQHDDIFTGVMTFLELGCGIEFLDQGENNAFDTLADAQGKIAPGFGFGFFCALAGNGSAIGPGILKGSCQLFSRSTRSVTTMIRHCAKAGCSSKALHKKTMVRDLPEPVVCQMTPP